MTKRDRAYRFGYGIGCVLGVVVVVAALAALCGVVALASFALMRMVGLA